MLSPDGQRPGSGAGAECGAALKALPVLGGNLLFFLPCTREGVLLCSSVVLPRVLSRDLFAVDN